MNIVYYLTLTTPPLLVFFIVLFGLVSVIVFSGIVYMFYYRWTQTPITFKDDMKDAYYTFKSAIKTEISEYNKRQALISKTKIKNC